MTEVKVYSTPTCPWCNKTKGWLKEIGIFTNNKNEIIIDRMSRTNIDGFYAAGDVADTQFKQAITGVAEGVTAAYSAYHYINEHNFICLHNDEEVIQNE